MKISRKLLFLVTVAAVAAAGTAYAAIPGADGLISTCHAKVSGVRYLRLIDVQAGEACKGSEKLLSWNQQGPPGPASPAAPAYGHIRHDGTIDQTRSANLAGATVTKPAGTRGLYCIDGLTFTPKNISVTLGQTLSAQGSGTTVPTPQTSFGGLKCPDAADVAVGLADPADGLFKRDHDFFLLIH